MIRIMTITAFALFLLAAAASGQQEDSTFVMPPSDSLHHPSDTTDLPETKDTLSEAQKAHLDFEQRRKDYQEEKVERKPNLSFYDSLVTYFASQRLNQRLNIEQAYFKDAGDYFHFDPSFFLVDYVRTPMRKTVQPFGLSGDRLNVISNGLPIRPFEHFIEPDGLMDLNDIPIAGDYDRYIIPGPTGILFGGDRAIASLITEPKRPKANNAESAILVDQGGFEYNYVRGKYSKLFSGGREIDMMIGYRNVDGDVIYSDDDVYHYAGRISQPVGLNYTLNASGQLYSRSGRYFVVSPLVAGSSIPYFRRDRTDRSAELSLDKYNAGHDAVSRVGYRYLCQGSHIGRYYSGRFDINGWGLFVAREWVRPTTAVKIEANSNHTLYHDGYNDFPRDEAEVYASVTKFGLGARYAFTAGARYIDGFDFLPSAAAVITVDRPGSYLLLSLGYAERAPSLNELHLRYQRAYAYSTDTRDYADQGSGELEKEKQLVASGIFELGSVNTNVRLSLTGGRIKDGIDWQYTDILDVGGRYRLFKPANEDIDFLDISLQQKLTLSDNLSLRSGAARHWVEYEYTPDKPYTPEYQLFSGLELHVFWPQRLIHFFAYGEMTYASEYTGYDNDILGKDIIVSGKLSFRIKDFRFHYVQQNVISRLYESREDIPRGSRYSYLGLVWDFLD